MIPPPVLVHDVGYVPVYIEGGTVHMDANHCDGDVRPDIVEVPHATRYDLQGVTELPPNPTKTSAMVRLQRERRCMTMLHLPDQWQAHHGYWGGELAANGIKLEVIGVDPNGWYLVLYRGNPRYVAMSDVEILDAAAQPSSWYSIKMMTLRAHMLAKVRHEDAPAWLLRRTE